MKKILVLANSDIGLYKFRKELLQSLIASGFEVYFSSPLGSMVHKLECLGCRFVPTKIERHGKNIIQEIKLFSTYFYVLKKVKPVCVLTYTIKPNLYGGILCRILKVPYIVNITGLGSAIEKENIFSDFLLLMYKLALKKADCVFYQNEYNMRYFYTKKVVKKNFYVLYGSGVNLKENSVLSYPEKKKTICFLFIGRIMREKGIREYLTAAKRIKEKGILAKFLILGDYEEDYKALIDKFEKEGFIHYMGYQENVRKYITQAHAVVLPSYHEGMSNVLLEAAAAARPVIASNIPGCRETFEDGVSGLAVKVRDTSDLEKKLENFIGMDYADKLKMGQEGRRRMEKIFDRNDIIAFYLREIKKIMER